MNSAHESLLSFRPAAIGRTVDRPLARALAGFAVQDWIVAAYLSFLSVAVLLGNGPRRPAALTWLAIDFAVFWSCLLFARSATGRFRALGDALYRVGLIGVVIGSFLQLHYIMPTASTLTLDAEIYQLDMRVFGFEPAEQWDRFVTPATTEWFAFFYYSYFFILCLYVLPIAVFESRTRILCELSLGLLLVVCVGHSLYLVVPGRGPYDYLGPRFEHALSGPFWWPLVRSAVDSVDGSLRKDIFPSLHTALPTFLTLFSFRNRAHRPYRYVWPITGLFTSQIILATMFLRWHYLADIVAGLTLATLAFVATCVVPSREARVRETRGLSPVWRALAWGPTAPTEAARR